MDYLRLLLQFERKEATSDPFAFRFGPQDYILPSQDGEAAEAHFPWSAALASELDALRRPGRPAQLVTQFAERLRQFVAPAGWSAYVQRIESARAAGQSVELLIRSAAAEIYSLPWELLSLRPGGACLGELGNVLLRYAWPACPVTPEAPPPRSEGGRILLAWSAAGGAVPVSEHTDAIARACRLGSHPFVPDSLGPDCDVLPHASVHAILRRLEAARSTGQPIAVLHLLCHGTESQGSFGLCLDGQDGQAVVDGYELRQVLAPFSDMVRLVVLSACDSGNTGAMGRAAGSVAQALHRGGFASVLASRFPLSVLGSIAFCRAFYETLLTGPDSLERAFLAARSALAEAALDQAQRDRPLDWASLQLYGHPPLERDTRPVVFRPYRGLLAFQPEHRRLFFGRDAESAEILGDLANLERDNKPRFLVVAGASGTGKSSVVLASAVPRLLEQHPGVQLRVIRPGSAPLQSLQHALADATGPLLLVVDQFEELFTQTATPGERQSFVQELWRLSCQAAPLVRVVITLRVDFVGQCGELLVSPSGPRLDRVAFDEAHRVFIAQQEPAQLRQCIEQPAYKVGLELEAGLGAALLADVGNEPGALPLLEDALDMLWLRRQGARLTHKAFAEIGGVVGALEKRADALVDALPPETQPLVRRLLTELVTVSEQGGSDTRRPRPLAELHSQIVADTTSSPEALVALVQTLCHERLLVLTHSGSTSQVGLAHEALIRRWRRLRTWLDEDRAALLAERRMLGDAERWQQQQEPSLLYRGAELLQAAAWRTARAQDGRRPSPLLTAFLSASEAQEALEAQQKQAAAQQLEAERQEKLHAAQVLAQRTRLAAVVLGVFFLAAAVAGVLAYRNSTEAQKNAVEAQKNSNKSRATLLVALAQNLKEDPTAVATLLREPVHQDSTLWTQSSVDALQMGIAKIVLRGHEDTVESVDFSPDGKKVVTGSFDKTARIWNADGSGVPLVLKGHEGWVSAVAFSPGGKKIVSGSWDRTARIWSADGSGAPLVLKGHGDALSSVAFSPDGKKIVTGSHDKTARIWNADGSGAPLVLKGHGGALSSAAFSADGTKVVTGSDDKTARIWNADGSGVPLVLKGHEDAVYAVDFSPDGKKIVTGSKDKTARIWNADGSGAPLVLNGHEDSVYAVDFSADGTKVVTGSYDKTARIWNADGSGAPLVLKGHENQLRSVAFSPDGKKVVTGSIDQTARIWNADDSDAPVMLKGHEDWVYAVAFSPDGNKVVTGSKDKTARIWNADGSGVPLVLRGHEDSVFAATFSPDGKKVVTGSFDKTARIWNADGSGAPPVLKGHEDWVAAVAFSPDGKQVVTGSKDKTARIWNADGSGVPLVLRGHEDSVFAATFSPDGKKVVTGSFDKTARIWNADGSGAPLVLEGHESAVYSATFSPDGKKIVTGSWDKTARIWNADGSGAPLVLKGHRFEIFSVAFSPDGKKIVTGSFDRTARIWNADGSGAPLVLKGHEDQVRSVAFSPDGKKIVTGSFDRTARIWIIASDLLLEALWNATSDCLPERRRQDILAEAPTDAKQGYERCRQEAAGRRGWAAP